MSESVAIITMEREAIAAQTELDDALTERSIGRRAVLLERAAEHLARAIKAAKEAVR
jgi:hypothetical protein